MVASIGMRLGLCINNAKELSMARCSCIICKKEFSNKGIFTHYLRRHEGKSFIKLGIYNCNACHKQFSSSQALAGHTQRSHILKDKQKEYGKRGSIKKLEMADREEISLSYPHSEETKDRMSIIACERLSKHSKYSKNTEYKPGIILESSFEVRTAIILDSLNIEWIKVRKGYVWDDNGKTRRYIPDFYLPDYDIFLDPKNDYLIKKDKKKIDSAILLNNIKIIVLSDDQISETFIKDLLL